MTEEQIDFSRKYPEALSMNLAPFGKREGGMGFLNRIFKTSVDGKKEVLIRNGDAVFRYAFQPGHRSLEDGLTQIEGTSESDGAESFVRNAKKFDFDIAFKEGGYIIDKDGWPKRSLIKRFRDAFR